MPRQSFDSASDRLASARTVVDELLGLALTRYLAEGAGEPALASSRPALRAACDSARDAGLRAEEMVVLLKERWRASPDFGADGFGRSEALARFVSGAIVEYYADAS